MLKLFAPFGFIFGWVMYQIFTVVKNYGITLILFTLLIKLLMVPLGIKQQKSVIVNARIQPKMQALQKMYGNNRERYGIELQKLYQEENFSPYASCLPTLLMFPVLFGMLDVIYYPLKHMLRMDAATISTATGVATKILGEGGLNRYSAEISVLNAVKANPAPFVEALGQEITDKMVNFDFTMFGLPLWEQPTLKPDGKSFGLYIALLLIPILSAVFAYIMSSLTMSGNAAASDGSAASNAMTGSMKLMMPLMSLWISFIVPAGVGIYWLLSNVFSVIQQIILNKKMNPAEAIAKAAAEAEAQKAAERQARIEARKKAREEAAARRAAGEPEPQENTGDSSKIAEARRRMAEKYGD